MSFVRNAWYVAGWARDFDRSLAKRTILGDEVVLYRKENGDPAALRDLCPHRSLPLSLGLLKGDAVECGYHGLTFDCSGACISVPGQESIPPNAKVKSYPVAERMGLIWIWMGDAGLADTDDIYDLPEYHDPAWGVGHGDALYVEANYLLLTDNLCDPAHVNYVHPTTLGDPAGEAASVSVEERDGCVTTVRWTPDSDPVGFFKVFGNFPAKVDRWQYYHMHVPSTAIIDFGSAAAGAGAMDGNRDDCIQVYSCHFMTPVDETITIDYWLHVRNFAPDDDSVTEGISEQFRIAFAEDKIILQAVQTAEEKHGVEGRAGIDIDAGPGLFRHLVGKAKRIEQQATAAE
ncbi:MAG: aromatic ring-hydroxylating dioxygenase subunit alpha [Rhodospirillaceae bacterium]|jgi:phenylpropionate dioxygenase-like ring-hydroxylating dioxygenase large terminal subunit|nr:aromatic ring-hydroxylating dioxygenase subunit alpha [Rhodospirillaceae bacterium]